MRQCQDKALLRPGGAGDKISAGHELAALFPVEQEARVARALAVPAQRDAANERQNELARQANRHSF